MNGQRSPAAVTTTGLDAGWAMLLEAVRAIDGLVISRLEGDFGLLATLGAGRRVHLALGSGVTTTEVAVATIAE